MFHAGELIGGRYRLRRLIGAGGMGAVWLVRNEATERDVAIKFMLPELAKTPGQLQRFFQEAKALGRVRHRAIVEIYDLGRIEQLADAAQEPRAGTPYLVMELLDGEPLDVVLRRIRRLPLRAALELVMEIARGLQAAHTSWIVHRDLKPANIFLHRDRDGVVSPKILDFGVSKLLQAGVSHDTTSGVVVGSPGYMSPEQAAGDGDIDARSDVWSLGAILYRCLTGKEAFREANYNATMLAIVMSEPAPLQSLVDLPDDVATIVNRCMQKSREDRYETADALADAIGAVLRTIGSEDGLRSLAIAVTRPELVADLADKTLATLAGDATIVDEPPATVPLGVLGVDRGDLPAAADSAGGTRRARSGVAIAAIGFVAAVSIALLLRRAPVQGPNVVAPSATAVAVTSAPPIVVTTEPVVTKAPVEVVSKPFKAKPAPPPKAASTTHNSAAKANHASEGVLDPGLP